MVKGDDKGINISKTFITSNVAHAPNSNKPVGGIYSNSKVTMDSDSVISNNTPTGTDICSSNHRCFPAVYSLDVDNQTSGSLKLNYNSKTPNNSCLVSINKHGVSQGYLLNKGSTWIHISTKTNCSLAFTSTENSKKAAINLSLSNADFFQASTSGKLYHKLINNSSWGNFLISDKAP